MKKLDLAALRTVSGGGGMGGKGGGEGHGGGYGGGEKTKSSQSS
jgi:hypothetical protein